MTISTRKQGYERDSLIIDTIEQYRVLTAEQIKELIFSEQSQGLRICQRRLKKLFDTGEILKKRDEINLHYYYFLDENLKQLNHIATTNQMFFDFKARLDNWEKVFSFNREIDYKFIRADGIVSKKNTVTNQYSFYYLECDLSRGNKFDKIQLYNRLFEEVEQKKFWWSQYTDQFPEILIRTVRPRVVERAIEKENRHGLNFKLV